MPSSLELPELENQCFSFTSFGDWSRKRNECYLLPSNLLYTSMENQRSNVLDILLLQIINSGRLTYGALSIQKIRRQYPDFLFMTARSFCQLPREAISSM